MSQNKSTHAQIRLLAGALLSDDKTITRFDAAKKGVMEYTRFSLRLSRGQSMKGYVDTVKFDANNAVMAITPTHVADFTPDSEDFVIVNVRLLTYGEGAIAHPYFNGRNRYTQAVTEIILMVRDMSKGEVYVCHRQGQDHLVRTQPDVVEQLLSPHGKVSDVLNRIVGHIKAAQNEINNGGIKTYDARQSVRAGAITPYGQYLIDSGKTDKALTQHRANQPKAATIVKS